MDFKNIFKENIELLSNSVTKIEDNKLIIPPLGYIEDAELVRMVKDYRFKKKCINDAKKFLNKLN